jgi:hypothetical protein
MLVTFLTFLYRCRKDNRSFPIATSGNLSGDVAVKSRRTPLVFEALLLFAFPLLFTLPNEEPLSGYPKPSS